jgi:hypothetical protein
MATTATSALAAEGKSKTYTDAKEAGLPYKIQGEYVGKFDADGSDQKFGMQIIALGEGKYRAIAYFGGLPGDGWDGLGKIEADGEEKDGVVKFEADEGSATLKDGTVTINSSDGEALGTLEQVSRKSPTLGAKPPEGAIVLFDGSNNDQWMGGRVEDGLLHPACVTKKKFNDFTLHVEFRTPFMPGARGQGRGNSGVYLQDRYEVQVLDSFGLEGLDNECGGFYSIKAPDTNMCFPPLSWQTYDIDFTSAKWEGDKKVKNAMVTVRHNGVLIHDNVEVPKGTPGRLDEGPDPAGISFQFHGNPVVFRNVWAVEK